MAVEYHESTVTNMEIDDSKTDNKQVFNGSRLQYSVNVLRNNPFRVATVCLGLLGVLLLAGVIGQSVHHRKVEQEHQKNLKAMSEEKENLQEEKMNLEASCDHLQQSFDDLSGRNDEMQADNNILSTAKDRLEIHYQLEDTLKDELQGEVEKLKAIIQDKKCPTGWKKFQVSCYYTSDDRKSWMQSREYCQSKGADLTIIKSQEEMTFINRLYESDKEVWIGLTDEGVEGEWRWVDGTPLTTAFWGKDQPNSFEGRNQDCVEYWHRVTGTGDWNDENCNVEQNWICEM